MERVWEYLTTDLPALRDLVDHELAWLPVVNLRAHQVA
jgi:hypothetical protein